MQLSRLDTELSEIVRPLMTMKPVIRVAPFVNTICIGVHCSIADEGLTDPAPLGSRAVGLADWNHPERLREHLLGMFMFYSSSERAAKYRRMANAQGAFDSLAVTHFRQRFVFVGRNRESEALVDAVDGRLGVSFFEEATRRQFEIALYTDILAQADSLIDSVVRQCALNPHLVKVGRLWPNLRDPGNRTVGLFVYSAPCVAYMLNASENFIPLSVDDNLLSLLPEYITHFVWHVPDEYLGRMKEIRDTVREYHQALFKAAMSAEDAEFNALSTACGDVLAAQHPSFP